MTELIQAALAALERYLPGPWLLVLLLAMAVIYIWYQYHQAKILRDRLSFEERKRESATEDLERILKNPHPSLIVAVTERAHIPISKRPRILVVDDEQGMCEVIGAVLSSEMPSLEIVFKANGVEALREIERQIPSLLIMDLIMPQLGGIGVLIEVKRRGWVFPTILISAYLTSEEEIAKRASAPLPRFELMPKPFGRHQLISAVKTALPS